MVGWFVWGAMDLAWTVEYAIQAGWSLIVPYIRLFPLTGLGAAESGVDCRVISVVAIASAFVSVASELAVAIFALGGCRGLVTADVLVKGLSRGAIATG